MFLGYLIERYIAWGMMFVFEGSAVNIVGRPVVDHIAMVAVGIVADEDSRTGYGNIGVVVVVAVDRGVE